MATKKRRRKKKQKKQLSNLQIGIICIPVALLMTIAIFYNSESKDAPAPTQHEVAQKSSLTQSIPKADTKKDMQKRYDDVHGTMHYGKARNDVTGKWRVTIYASNELQKDMAAEYYKTYFESDDEIHALINLTLKTTAKITKGDGDYLYVTTYEYVDGEEHDAKLLFGGMVLTEEKVEIK